MNNKTIVLILSLAGMLSCQNKPEENSSHEHSQLIHLNAEQIELANIRFGKIEVQEIEEWIDVAGEVDAPPENRASISTPYGGYVTYIKVYEGDKISKGQVLARLSDPLYITLQTDFLDARVAAEFLKKDFERKKELLNNKSISDKQFEEAKRDYESNQVLIQSLEAGLRLAGIEPELIVKNGIQKEVEIKSPIHGFARAINANLGKHMGEGEVLLEVIDPSHVHVELSVFPNQVHLVNFKQKVYFRLTGTTQEYQGYVKLISQSVDEERRSITVHVHPDDEELMLMPGTFVQARIITGSREGKSIPLSGLTKEGDHFVAYKKVDNGVEPVHFRPKWVTSEMADASSLPEGEYVLNGAEKLESVEEGEHGH